VFHTFKTEDEAIARANDSDFGLYASVFTQDIDRAIRVSKKLEAGMVGINAASPTLHYDVPFGGWKQSGYGKEMGKDWVASWCVKFPLFAVRLLPPDTVLRDRS